MTFIQRRSSNVDFKEIILMFRYSDIPLLRLLLGLSESGLISGVVLILNIEYSKCSKISNVLCHTFLGQICFYAVVS